MKKDLTTLSDADLVSSTASAIYASYVSSAFGFAATDTDSYFNECNRRGRPDLYNKAHDKAIADLK